MRYFLPFVLDSTDLSLSATAMADTIFCIQKPWADTTIGKIIIT